MKIILTGATGLIGSRFEELMFENHEIIPLSSEQGVDITDKESIANFLTGKNADVIIHLAAKTDVDACETDKNIDLGILNIDGNSLGSLDVKSLKSEEWKGKKTAFAVNTIGTKNLYEIAKEKGIKFVYISTDFVFSGHDDSYTEESIPSPVDWYGATKYFAEKLIDISSNLIVRLSFPYGYPSPVKKDVFWKLHDFIREREEVSLISDQKITPTFIDDIVAGLDFLISNNANGVFNLTGSGSLSPKEIGEKIKETFGYRTLIKESHLADVYAGKAARPLQSIMKNDKLANLGFKTKSFDEGLALISSAL